MKKSCENNVQESVNFYYERSIKMVDFHERMSYNKNIENRKTGDKKNEKSRNQKHSSRTSTNVCRL